MAPRINLFTARNALRQQCQSLTIRPRQSTQSPINWSNGRTAYITENSWRLYSSKSEKDFPEHVEQPKGPTQDQLPHVSQEAAAIDKILSGKKCDGNAPGSPELEQGTPIEEMMKRDEDALKYAPKVIRDQAKKGTRSYSTSARLYQEVTQQSTGAAAEDPSIVTVANMINLATERAAENLPGLKFGMPAPLPKTENVRSRYDPVVEQFTKLLMEDGKLSRAQKDMEFILNHLRTSAPPKTDPRRRLLTSLPSPQLPLNPVIYLNLLVDSVAPLIKIRQQKGLAGGGASVPMPVPLAMRQRRRTAIRWILEAAEKRKDSKLALRVANELVAVAEGRSGVWDKREQVHKIGVSGLSDWLKQPQQPQPIDLPPISQSFDVSREDVKRIPSKLVPLEAGPLSSFSPSSSSATRATRPFNQRILPNTSSTSLRRTAGISYGFVPHDDTASSINSGSQDHEGTGFSPLPSQNLERAQQRFIKSNGRAATGLRPHILWAEALEKRNRGLDKSFRYDLANMKFSHSLQFNSVPDWSAYYIAYDNLKKLIYSLEKQIHHPDTHGAADSESAPLLDTSVDTDTIFRRALDAELEKICSFYQIKELTIFGEVEDVLKEQAQYKASTDGMVMEPVTETVIKSRTLSIGSRPRTGSILHSLGLGPNRRESTISGASVGEDDEDDEDDRDSDDLESPVEENRRPASRTRSHTGRYRDLVHGGDRSDGFTSEMGDSRLWNLGNSRHEEEQHDPHILDLYNVGIALKKRVISVYVSLCELKSYIQLNKTGFSKALKKYDKILDRSLRRVYMNGTVSPAYPFTDSTGNHVDENIRRIEHVYAEIVTRNDLSLARRELRLHLREHVVWERNTVWREMIGIERKAQAANMGIRRTLLGGDHDPSTAQRQGDVESKGKEIETPLGRWYFPEWMCSLSFFSLVGIIIVFAILLSVPIMEKPEQQNCLAMLVFVSLLWATEVIPLFVTSLLIPFLVVILRVMRSEEKPHARLAPDAATKAVFASMWTSVIMLLLGGFTIAAALSKYDIARRMATFVLSRAGTSPRIVLITNMFVSMFLSMWISNVAAPVLCYSIIQPLLRNLPSESNFSKALILGIALAANVGGAASPIASPQNIIALENMYPAISWGTWFFISIPVCVLSILAIWVILLVTFQPSRGTTIVPIRPVRDRFTGTQWFVTLTTLVTITLWCFSHQLDTVFGDMGVIAIIPMVLFFGSGILTKEDFNNFLWTIIILAAGGLVLGKAVTSSGLLHTIAGAITERVAHFSLYGVLLVFSGLILVMATFISHTVAALIVLPLVQQVGVGMENPHPNLLVMTSALMCSVAMGLPTSGFPNMTAIMMEIPSTGQRYLRVSHFLTRGIPGSLVSFVIVVTVGYVLMSIAGL
ncbi:plasma membrane phosphate transporter Pho87, putative [Talaromyces stipitatus ATCC 10500]|uniref:Small ribosomal subunit protein uS7m n=1 Tax=Talaromyces stipitatus (strain ATCC 10500 / CBS 375.48 / QM 6759 / NRRL 1006) TaxID=441959 RepID=B8MGK3_TALSN|nr:plasma membrane phosphate transporter Pho87, putative [Talaromyces stipitatus ATCC 10500]EED16754.1 plasma membrane phosphate transporter Pho87, putative [Talaromyces stipitatus ATCC 10500]